MGEGGGAFLMERLIRLQLGSSAAGHGSVCRRWATGFTVGEERRREDQC